MGLYLLNTHREPVSNMHVGICAIPTCAITENSSSLPFILLVMVGRLGQLGGGRVWDQEVYPTRIDKLGLRDHRRL